MAKSSAADRKLTSNVADDEFEGRIRRDALGAWSLTSTSIYAHRHRPGPPRISNRLCPSSPGAAKRGDETRDDRWHCGGRCERSRSKRRGRSHSRGHEEDVCQIG